MSVAGSHLVVNPADLADCKVVPAAFGDPAPGKCLLRIDSFAMTANNITYGLASRQLGYWEFFPHDGDYGRIPVWGFADIVASAHPDVAVGTRLYGYLPMSTHLEIEPGKVSPGGMMDMSEARQGKAPIYNGYAICAADPMHRVEHEGLISLFRPLYTTSFLLDDFHRANSFFGAAAVVLTSASSKTSLGLAHALRSGGTDGVQVIGLTGRGNAGFVEGVGVYDQVVTYDALDAIDAPTLAYVDMAGNGEVRRTLHARYGDDLKNACLVGGTHWKTRDRDVKNLPGPRPEFFFAPTYAQERIKALGGGEFQRRLGAAWSGFVGEAEGWIDVVETRGNDAAMDVYLQTFRGQVPPNVGNILGLA